VLVSGINLRQRRFDVPQNLAMAALAAACTNIAQQVKDRCCLFVRPQLDRTADRRDILTTEISSVVTAWLVNSGGQLVSSNGDPKESDDVIEPLILP
jgi:hypothetical protein